MAYIPPHKRHSKEANSTPAPTPFPFQTPGHRNPNQKYTTGHGRILYSKEAISRWFVIPSNDSEDQHGELSSSVRLNEFTAEYIELEHGKKYAILVHEDDHPNKEVNENVNHIVKPPWVSITEKIQQDLLTSFQTAREVMCKDGPELNLPRFVFRFGKILFQRSPFGILETLDNANKSSAVENVLSPLRKRLYTNVPNSFCEAIPKTGLDFVIDEEHYYVTVYDKSQPDKAIVCKCNVTEGAGELQLHKIGLKEIRLKEIRQMVVDISCLEKNIDFRLLLSSKRILASLTDDEKQSLNSLVNSAVIYSKEEGRLRLSAGKKSVCGRYEVAGYIHSKCRVYKSSFMRLKIRQFDGFYEADHSDVSQEVSLRIPELTSQLRDATVELNSLIDTVRDTLKLVWENFLCWEGSYT